MFGLDDKIREKENGETRTCEKKIISYYCLVEEKEKEK